MRNRDNYAKSFTFALQSCSIINADCFSRVLGIMRAILNQDFKNVFTPFVVTLLALNVTVAIFADFQTHFGFENLAFSAFAAHPIMFLRHMLEALFASLLLPFFFMISYVIVSKNVLDAKMRIILISTSFFLIAFHSVIIYRFAYLPPTPY